MSTQTICRTIDEVCEARRITCLHAVESGSRVWGFASPDSDFDVRLIYCHPQSWYVRIFEDKDSFDYIDNDLLNVPFDIGGWDIKKVLQLLYKSNAAVFEWLNSPIVYQQHAFTKALKKVSEHYFHPFAVFQHYRGIAKTAAADLNFSQPVKLKKVCYLLRALLAAEWVMTHQTPPPVPLNALLVLLDGVSKDAIDELIAHKRQSIESEISTISPVVKSAIATLWRRLDNFNLTPSRKPDANLLNELYRSVVFDGISKYADTP